MFTQYPFDLNKIKQFNPALIYTLVSEASPIIGKIDPLSTPVELCIQSSGQIQDIFNAYFYAQETVLPAIEKIGILNITTEQIIGWIDQIHFYIAATLGQEYEGRGLGVLAGQPSKVQILSFHQGVQVKNILTLYLSDLLPTSVDVITLLNEEGVDKKLAEKFIQLLLDIRDNHLIEIPKHQKVYYKPPCSKGDLAFGKLSVLYHTKKLTSEEKQIVDSVVKIHRDPIEIPEARQKFAEDLLLKLKTFDLTKIESVSELVSWVFHGLIKEHWYFNCNKRTAICFFNILLRALNQPSILIRNPNEDSDPDSSYSQAVNKPELWVEHIKNRIQETKISGGYKDEILAEVVTRRVRLASVLYDIKQQFPGYNGVNENYKAASIKFIQLNTVNLEDQLNFVCPMLDYLYNGFKTLLSKLQQQSLKQQPLKETKAPEPVQRQYSVSEIEEISEKLHLLTGQTSWKAYQKGSVFLLEVKDKQIAEQLKQELNKTEALEAVVKWNPATKNPVVYVASINLEKLREIEVSKEENLTLLNNK